MGNQSNELGKIDERYEQWKQEYEKRCDEYDKWMVKQFIGWYEEWKPEDTMDLLDALREAYCAGYEQGANDNG